MASVPPGSDGAPFVVGDIQGCLDSLLALLDRAELIDTDGDLLPAHAGATRSDCGPEFSPWRAPLWLAGDLVNRGPRSLDTLRWAYRNRARLVAVLGNHDLHLLAVATGIRAAHRSDTLDDILAASDRDELLDWLRSRPLAVHAHGYLLVHAGMPPQWSAKDALRHSDEFRRMLSGPDWREFLAHMYGNEPDRWDDALRGHDRMRFIVNAMTRMRLCAPDGRMDLHAKQAPGAAPTGLLPWFDLPGRASVDTTVVFGHWSALGWFERTDVISLDTGCVWGGTLTGVWLATRERLQADCPRAADPASD